MAYSLTQSDIDRIKTWSNNTGVDYNKALDWTNNRINAGIISNAADFDAFEKRNTPAKTATSPITNTPAPVATSTDPNASKIVQRNPNTVQSTTPSAATTVGFNPDSFSSQGYNAKQSTFTPWDVTKDALVENRMAGLVSSESPYLKVNETAALERMAGRGLVNSSMATGEALKAVSQAALPIATADAATYASAGQFNAGQKNQMAMFNTQQENTALQSAMVAANEAQALTVKARNDAAALRAQAQNTANAAEAEALNRQAAQRDAEANKANADYVAAQNEILRAQAAAASSTKQQSTALAVDAGKTRDLRKQDIMNNPDLEPDAKQKAIDNVEADYQRQIENIATLTGVPDVKELLDFTK